MKEPLSEYVKRIMDDKNWGVREVERNSGGKISASHISKVLSGKAANLTASKIVALASGLKVDPHEIFFVITGCPVPESQPADMVAFADAVQKLVSNPKLAEVIRVWAKLPARDEAIMLRSLKLGRKLNSRPGKKKG